MRGVLNPLRPRPQRKTRGKDLFGPHLYYASQSRSKENGEPTDRQTSGGEVTRVSAREVLLLPLFVSENDH